MSLAEDFFYRFAGNGRAHGQYIEKGKLTEKGKQDGGGITIHEPPTVDLWEKHLKGEYGLGIVPINESDMCRWGAIDIDIYDGSLDFDKLGKRIIDLELPLIPFRTKSGGIHLYLFAREDIPAALIRAKLMDWAIYLGYGKSEIFPKQTRLASEADIGNWINMPYFGGNKSNRYAIYDGKKLTAEKFLELAEVIAVTEYSLQETNPKVEEKAQGLWEQCPPCLYSLSVTKFPNGSRNRGLFNIAVYLRKRYGEGEWENYLEKYNQEFMDPPVPHREVQQVVKNVNKKDYGFTCKEEPILSACNRQVCLTRKWGIGQDKDDPGVVFGRLVKINATPPIWIWDVNGARIQLATMELKDQARFHTRVMEDLNMWPDKVKPSTWVGIVSEALKDVEVVDVPAEASPRGQILEALEEYCTKYGQAKTKEGVLQDKPYTEEGRTYFRGSHFRRWLEQHRMRVTERDLWFHIRESGGEHHFWNIKGRGVNLWSMSAFQEQNEAFEVPGLNLGDEEEM